MRYGVFTGMAGWVWAWFLMTSSLQAGEFHVSPRGDDAGRGSERNPFRTIERARDAVREKIAAGLREPWTVVLRGGVYELREPLTLGPEDSGTEAFPITYAAFPGETVVLSGGRRITGWKKDDRGRWTTHLPDVEEGKWFFRQLTVGNRRAIRARWPDENDVLRITGAADDVKRFTFNLPLPGGNLEGQNAELVVYESWSITRGLVAASDENALSTATPMGWIGHGAATTAGPGKYAFLEHGRAFLDRPGEWFLERATGILTYMAQDGEDPGKEGVVAPILEQVLRIRGTKERPVRHVRFQGIGFAHTNFPLPGIGYREIQAAHYGTRMEEETHVQPVSVECVYAEECRFDRCRFAHFGASGIGFGPGCRSNAVVRCTIEDIGGNGVMIGWRGIGSAANGRLDADWEDPGEVPTGNEVSGCRIRRCGAESAGAVGVFAAFSADTRIVGNAVSDLPYTGISIGFRWNTTPTSQARCLVERNHVHDVMKKLADGGGVYTLGFQPGTILRRNYIHDVHRSNFTHGGAPNNGFFIDQGSKGFLFEANVVEKTSGDPVRFNQSRREWHEWKDNFFGDEEAKTPAAQAIIRKAGPDRRGS